MGRKRDRSPLNCRRPHKKILLQHHGNHRDWAGLPRDVLRMVLGELISLQDYIRFGGVCRDWQSLVLEDYKNRSLREKFWQNQQLPLLLLPSPTAQSFVMRNSGFFYSLTKQNILTNTRAPLLDNIPKRFVGSSFGWLILVDDSLTITLFNPFMKLNTSKVEGGNINTIRIASSLLDHRDESTTEGSFVNADYFVRKAVLSADPALSPNDYVVVLTYGTSKRVAFIRPSMHRAWCHADNLLDVQDIYLNSRNGLFYGLLHEGAIVSFDPKEFNSQHMPVHTVAPEIPWRPGYTQVDNCMYICNQAYMVETSKKDLLQIRRFGIVKVEEEKVAFITTDFQVFKCRPDSSGWDELESLGDDILFLGDNNSLTVRASDFVECRPGSIYYTFAYNAAYMALKRQYFSHDPMDMGVYTLETRRLYPSNIHLTDGWCDAIAKQPPVWIVPTFQTTAI